MRYEVNKTEMTREELYEFFSISYTKERLNRILGAFDKGLSVIHLEVLGSAYIVKRTGDN